MAHVCYQSLQSLPIVLLINEDVNWMLKLCGQLCARDGIIIVPLRKSVWTFKAARRRRSSVNLSARSERCQTLRDSYALAFATDSGSHFVVLSLLPIAYAHLDFTLADPLLNGS
jgi:hypothetical protein